MHVKSFILILLIFIGKLVFGQETVDRIFHLPDSLIETYDYTIYKTDTFNVRDGNGLIQGKGIIILKDSIVELGVSSHSFGYHNGSKIATCDYHQNSTNVYVKVKEVFYGQFHNNLITGVWVCFGRNRRVEMNYENGLIQGPVKIFYDSGELMFSGTAIAGKDNLELKKFTKSGILVDTIEWWLSDITELYF